jgi:hypothetical protein
MPGQDGKTSEDKIDCHQPYVASGETRPSITGLPDGFFSDQKFHFG